MTRSHYEAFFATNDRRNTRTFEQCMEEGLGRWYSFSTTPVFLSMRQFACLKSSTLRLVQATLDVSNLVRVFGARLARESKELPAWTRNLSGHVDFHVEGDDHQAIDIDTSPSPFSLNIEDLERKFTACHELPHHTTMSGGLLDRLARELCREGGGDIGLLSLAAGAQASERPFRYFRNRLEERGVRLTIGDPRRCMIDSKRRFLVAGRAVTRAYNLLSYPDWLENRAQLPAYTMALTEQPELFFPSPLAWKLADRTLLAWMCDPLRSTFGMRQLPDPSIPDTMLLTGQDPGAIARRFGSSRNLVLKPLHNDAKSSIQIRPDPRSLREFLRRHSGHAIAQRYVPPGTMPYVTRNGVRTTTTFDVRVLFVGHRVAGAYARVRSPDQERLQGEERLMAPVIIPCYSSPLEEGPHEISP